GVDGRAPRAPPGWRNGGPRAPGDGAEARGDAGRRGAAPSASRSPRRWAGCEAGRPERAGEPCQDQQRQRTIMLIRMMVARALLLPVGRLVRGSEVEHNGGRRL